MAILTTTSNIKGFSKRLENISEKINDALDKGLTKWAVIAHKQAVDNLSGPSSNAGGYPIAVQTGYLRRSEGYVTPRQRKAGISAQSGEAWLFNTASYATDVHEGNARHSRIGSRPFMKNSIETSRKAGMMAIRTALHESLIR